MSAIRSHRVLGAALVLSVLCFGCGGRAETEEDRSPTTKKTDGGLPKPAPSSDGGGGGVCTECEGEEECTYCFIHGFGTTYRCPPGTSPPLSGCMNLSEVYNDRYGKPFTCYYCD